MPYKLARQHRIHLSPLARLSRSIDDRTTCNYYIRNPELRVPLSDHEERRGWLAKRENNSSRVNCRTMLLNEVYIWEGQPVGVKTYPVFQATNENAHVTDHIEREMQDANPSSPRLIAIRRRGTRHHRIRCTNVSECRELQISLINQLD